MIRPSLPSVTIATMMFLYSSPNFKCPYTIIFVKVQFLYQIKYVLFQENYIHIQGFSYVVQVGGVTST